MISSEISLNQLSDKSRKALHMKIIKRPKKMGLASKMVFCYQNCSDLLWEKNCSTDPEKLLKFEAESQEFAKFLRIRTIRIQIGKNYWDLETCMKS